MGGCLSSQAADDLSLLNDSTGDGASLGPGDPPPLPAPPPPDQDHTAIPVYHPTPSQARLATQLTEEEQIRIAQRIGLIQHLPKGIFDPGSEPSEKKIKEKWSRGSVSYWFHDQKGYLCLIDIDRKLSRVIFKVCNLYAGFCIWRSHPIPALSTHLPCKLH
ncbi:RING finger protein 11-like isoform X1 [Crotalus tigris]|uniref:RING finger protein 11-like isoform X1 n=1 Tax=Crotalus tigris TaxID=88082 RepID=UPI00192F9922|nr:RING finger protein 11-like isoform X1 [Crotalus tigris]